MLRKLSMLPLILAFLCSVLPPARAYAMEAFLTPAMAAAVQVGIFDDQGEVIGWGSGSLIDPQGLVLTNYHVVAHNAAADHRVSVWLVDPQADDQMLEYQGMVIAQDPQLDLAVIHLETTIDARRQSHPLTADQKFPVVALGDSDAMTPGDAVYVLGYPDTAQGQLALTDGKISNWLKENGAKWLVADVGASHGNSGGLMLNSRGQLIGVPTRIRSDSEVSEALRLQTKQANQLVVEAVDSTITLYANGEKLASIEDTTFDRAGDIAIGVIGDKAAQAIVNFDNLLLTEPSASDPQGDWQQLQDPSGIVSMEVPANWQMLNSDGSLAHRIYLAAGASDDSAASMLAVFLDQQTQALDPEAILNQTNQIVKRSWERGCTTRKRVPYTDQRFQGSYDVWSNCTHKTERLITLVVHTQDNTPILLTLAAYFSTDNWPALVKHMLDSITVQAKQTDMSS